MPKKIEHVKSLADLWQAQSDLKACKWHEFRKKRECKQRIQEAKERLKKFEPSLDFGPTSAWDDDDPRWNDPEKHLPEI